MRWFSLALGLLAGCTLIVSGQLGDCGDNQIQGGNGEECDDGNNRDGDGCSRDCRREEPETCGDGVFEAGEICDFKEEAIPVGDGEDEPVDLLLRDVNLDGFLDAIVLLEGEQESSAVVLVNQGDASQKLSLTSAQLLLFPFEADTILVEDFNNDDLFELVAVDAVTGALHPFSGIDGSNTVVEGTPLNGLGVLGGVVAGDVDGDANIDIVVSQSVLNLAAILSATGVEVDLLLAASFEVVNKPGALALEDLNDDGVVDLVVASPEGDEVAIVQSGLDGGLPEGELFSVSEEDEPIAFLIEDFDGDTNPDLAVLNEGSSSVAIFSDPLTNIQNQNKKSVDTFAKPNAMAAGDLDRDGDPDLVVALERGVEIFQNDQGVLTRFASISLNNNEVESVALGDINGDGALDILAALPDRSDLAALLATP